MMHGSPMMRGLLVYAICLPLAIILGYLLTTPLGFTSLLVVFGLFTLLVSPFLLKWYHPLLLLSWNASMVLFFLPGRPQAWLVLVFVGAVIAAVQRALNKEMRFIHVPALTWPLILLAVVILATAKWTGGVGFGAFGSEVGGGRRYLMIFAAIMGYFVLTSQPVPPQRRMLYVALYYLGALTNLIGIMLPYVPQELYFLFWIFPVETVGLEQVGGDIVRAGEITRFIGLPIASLAVYSFLLARYGIRGILELRHGWRLALFLTAAALSTVGGFRSRLVLVILLFVFQFFLEGLHRTRYLYILLMVGALGAGILLPNVQKLPFTVQRSLSVLPIQVDPIVEFDTRNSTEWRLRMWDLLWDQVPKYLWVGKGYGINPHEHQFAMDLVKQGRMESSEAMIISGDYHSGPLTVLIPLGIFGAAGFLWFLGAAFWVLYRNFRYGDESAKLINTLLLADFLTRTVFFLVVFGSFYTDLVKFVGIVGLSIALNRGVRKSSDIPGTVPASEPPALGVASRHFPVPATRTL